MHAWARVSGASATLLVLGGRVHDPTRSVHVLVQRTPSTACHADHVRFAHFPHVRVRNLFGGTVEIKGCSIDDGLDLGFGVAPESREILGRENFGCRGGLIGNWRRTGNGREDEERGQWTML